MEYEKMDIRVALLRYKEEVLILVLMEYEKMLINTLTILI